MTALRAGARAPATGSCGETLNAGLPICLTEAVDRRGWTQAAEAARNDAIDGTSASK